VPVNLPQTPGQWHQRVWSLSWPIFLANLTTPLVGAVDTAVMGRMPDPAFIGAVAVGATIFNAVYWIFGFLRMGTTGLMAQAFGARDGAELSSTPLRAVTIALVLGAALLALQSPLKTLVLWIMPASEQVEALALTYFSIRIWGAPALLVHFVVLGTLFGLQQMRWALLVSVLLNVANVTLDLLFVVGFGWGVEGVAAATVISEWLAAITGLTLMTRVLRNAGAVRPSSARVFRPDKLVALFHVSANLIIRSFFVQLPFFTFTALSAGFGDRVLAANAVLMQLFFIMSYGLDSLAHSAESLTGHAFGARDRHQLRAAARYTLLWSIAIALAIAVAYALLGGLLIDALTVLPEVRETARAYLPWVAAAPLAAVVAFHLDGVFIGTTRTAELRNSMFVAAICFAASLWVCLGPLGNHGLWLSMTLFMLVRSLLLAWQYPRVERLAGTPVQG
jgi:MATE family multidrug resistance protein